MTGGVGELRGVGEWLQGDVVAECVELVEGSCFGGVGSVCGVVVGDDGVRMSTKRGNPTTRRGPTNGGNVSSPAGDNWRKLCDPEPAHSGEHVEHSPSKDVNQACLCLNG